MVIDATVQKITGTDSVDVVEEFGQNVSAADVHFGFLKSLLFWDAPDG